MNRSQAFYNVIIIKVFHSKIVYAFNHKALWYQTKTTLYHILLINSKKKYKNMSFIYGIKVLT